MMTHQGSKIATAVALVAGALVIGPVPAGAAEHGPKLETVDWTFAGPFGTFDRAQLQRGFKIYEEVCSGCHSMKFLHYRNLGEPGGPEFSVKAVKALAKKATIEDGPNDEGEMFEREGKPSDAFPKPFPNEKAARASNNGALPPDFSVLAKARAHGPDYIYSLLIGYADPPHGEEVAEGMHYNKYFAGHQIAMAKPIEDEAVEYSDGTQPTLKNYAKDVAAFLMWAAEPKLEERNRVGFRVMVYLVLLVGFLYVAKRRVWSRIKH